MSGATPPTLPDPTANPRGASSQVAGHAAALGVVALALTLAVGQPSARGEALVAVSVVAASLVVAAALREAPAARTVHADQVEANARFERVVFEGLGRSAAAVECAAAAPLPASAPDGADTKALRHAEFRDSIRHGRWSDAADLLRALAENDPDTAQLADELAGARQAAGREHRAKLEAAREVNDTERVLDLRDELKPLLDADELRALDRDLAQWFMTAIHRRLRTGTVRPDVVALAARVAGSLDETPEGASLRASLPTLRRAAGLCPRCSRPYTGIDDACPACLSGAPAASEPLPPAATAAEPAGSDESAPGDSTWSDLDL